MVNGRGRTLKGEGGAGAALCGGVEPPWEAKDDGWNSGEADRPGAGVA